MDETASRPDPLQLGAYFDLIEVVGLLRHEVEQQLKEDGDLSYVQFQLLAKLGDDPEHGQRMTDLADGVVYSRSGLTYQSTLLEQRGLIRRTPSTDDERATTVTITGEGLALLGRVLPGHIVTVDRLFYSQLSRPKLAALAGILRPLKEHMRSMPPRSARPRRTR
jgi:DNA-binding MarR family transcriptional regulator